MSKEIQNGLHCDTFLVLNRVAQTVYSCVNDNTIISFTGCLKLLAVIVWSEWIIKTLQYCHASQIIFCVQWKKPINSPHPKHLPYYSPSTTNISIGYTMTLHPTVMHSGHKESTAPQDSTTWVIHLLLSESFSVHGACDDTAASTCSKFLFHPKSNLHLVDAFFSYA
jgi:hypothetical protein